MLMMESAVQMPALIQTVYRGRLVCDWLWFVGYGGCEGCENLPAMGGKKTASTARKTSELHMAPR